jgi:hypothetical protein
MVQNGMNKKCAKYPSFWMKKTTLFTHMRSEKNSLNVKGFFSQSFFLLLVIEQNWEKWNEVDV